MDAQVLRGKAHEATRFDGFSCMFAFWLHSINSIRREVEAANPAAVNLYRKVGFEAQANPNKLSKNLFMIKYL